jgi:AraC-like DNA-binding protein
MPSPTWSFRGAHAFAAVRVANAFEALRVAAGFWDGRYWTIVHEEENLIRFADEHGVEAERVRYNTRSIAKVRTTGETVLGELAGLKDLFVPIRVAGRVRAVLVTGPFMTARSTSAEILQRWRALSGCQGHPADAEFLQYLRLSLRTLVLPGASLRTFRRLVECLARLMGGQGPAEPVLAEADALRAQIENVRFVDRAWDATRTMVDRRTTRSWSSPFAKEELARVGLSEVPDGVLVDLVVSRHIDADPVDALVQHDAFQRACVELARQGGAAAGKVGDHGVMFLDRGRTQKHTLRRLLQLHEKASRLARRFDFDLHPGISALPSSASLSEKYVSALEAAGAALAGGVKRSVRDLRRELGRRVEESPEALAARFELYAEAVSLHSVYRLDVTGAHLEAGFDRVAETLLASGALDQKGFEQMSRDLQRATREARTVADLVSAYRDAVLEMGAAARRPGANRRERSLARALSYVADNYAEPLPLSTVARVAGFAPSYFSVLFKRREKMTFEHYVRRLRLERAQQLLAQTDLDVGRVALLAGFRTPGYLARVFKRATGLTPLESRRRARPTEPGRSRLPVQ